MSIKKQIFTALLIAGISSLPMIANAGNLLIHNRTDFDSTSRINQGVCSAMLGQITPAGKDLTIPENVIRMACMTNMDHCEAEVFLSTDCSGNSIGTVFFNVNSGFISTTNESRIHKDDAFEVTIK